MHRQIEGFQMLRMRVRKDRKVQKRDWNRCNDYGWRKAEYGDARESVTVRFHLDLDSNSREFERAERLLHRFDVPQLLVEG